MALIKINGVDIPTPSDYKIGINDINKVERNANGDMLGERITTKRKIELAWKSLSPSQLSQVFNAVSSLFFIVDYFDVQDNAARTGTFYAGDRNCGMISFLNGVPKYEGIKFNLIER